MIEWLTEQVAVTESRFIWGCMIVVVIRGLGASIVDMRDWIREWRK